MRGRFCLLVTLGLFTALSGMGCGSSSQSVGVDSLANTKKSPNSGDTSNVLTSDGTPKEYAYIAEEDGTLLQFKVGTEGRLTALSPPSVSIGSPVRGIGITPNGQYVYVSVSSSGLTAGKIAQYRIGADGTLTPLSPPTVATGRIPTGITVSPDSKYAYVANVDGIWQYSLGTDGSLTPLTPSVVDANTDYLHLAIAPKGTALYAPSPNGHFLAQYKINGDGTLAPLSPATIRTGIKPGSDMFWGAYTAFVTRNGQFVYVPMNWQPGPVVEYRVNADLTLTPLDSSPAAEQGGPMCIGSTPDGQYLYVTNNPSIIAQYKANTDGSLSVLGPPFAYANLVNDFVVDPTGKYAYTVNQGQPISSKQAEQTTTRDSGPSIPLPPQLVLDGYVSQYRIETDGRLTGLPSATFRIGRNAVAIALTLH